MADWELTFRTPTHASIKIDACQQLLASIYGTEPSTTYGPRGAQLVRELGEGAEHAGVLPCAPVR